MRASRGSAADEQTVPQAIRSAIAAESGKGLVVFMRGRGGRQGVGVEAGHLREPGGGKPLRASSSTSTQSSSSPRLGGSKVLSPLLSKVPITLAVPARGLNHHART